MGKEQILRSMVVAIDGPSASGKSTTARLVARRLGLAYLDTGAMYRTLTLAHLQAGEEAAALAGRVSLARGEGQGDEIKVLLDGEEVGERIRSKEVEARVSEVSAEPRVREAMVCIQRREAHKGGIVLEGRDIGSVVVPWAQVKVFLDASRKVRAERRHAELRAKGIERSREEVEREIAARDRKDSARSTSPLKRMPGVLVVDTSQLTVEAQVEAVAGKANQVAARLASLQRGGEKSSRVRIRADYCFGQWLIRMGFRILFGLRIFREEELSTDENFIFACNHLSYVDPPLVGSTLPREVHFMAKEELFRNRAFAWLIRTYNAIPIRRGAFDRRAMERSLTLLQAGRSLLIFPEGTRMREGKLGEPKSGVGYLALHSGVPVVPLYVHGSNRLLVALARRSPLTVVQGRPIRLTEAVDRDSLTSDDYRDYSRMIMAAIAALRDTHPSRPGGADSPCI